MINPSRFLLKITLIALLVVVAYNLHAQKHTISGYVTDIETGERLLFAAIADIQSQRGTTSNNYGYFSLTLPEGNHTIRVSYTGYLARTIQLNLLSDTTLNPGLQVSGKELEEVVVSGQRNKVEETQMSLIDVPKNKLQSVPVILGENDILKVIQLMPGVKGGTEGTSGIYVRGGSPEQNLFLLDGVPIYNASHLLGFFSVFNPDAIKSVKLYKGGFPAHYGGRLSSVVDISMKDGNMKKMEGNFSAGLISSKLSLEGPIVKDRTSFIFSARRTYLDLLAKPVLFFRNLESKEKVKAGAYFHDLNLKVNHVLSDRSRLFLSAYYGKDEGYTGTGEKNSYSLNNKVYNFNSENLLGMDWGNTMVSFRWNYLINNKLFSNTTFTFSHYNFGIGLENKEENLTDNTSEGNLYRYYSGIRDLTAKTDFDYFPLPGHNIKFGILYTHHKFSPGITQIKSENTSQNISQLQDSISGTLQIMAHELAAYAEDEMTITDRLGFNAGIYLSAFLVQGQTYLRPQPRFSARYMISGDLSLKASYSRMVQHVHLLTTSGISLPTDLWLPATKRFEPPVSDQYAFGMAFNLPKQLILTIEGYYKEMKNLIEYKEGATFIGSSSNWEDKVEKGKGWSYGVELLLEKTIGKTTGWIGYTLSWSNRQFENLNFGKVFPAKYDNRHDINISVTHRFSDKFDIGMAWVYNTGNTVTLGLMEYREAHLPTKYSDNYPDYLLTEYGGRNSFRLPAYHRLDLGINFHKKKKHGIRTWSISAYNAYNQLNPFLVQWQTKTGTWEEVDGRYVEMPEKIVLTKYCLFPIIPSVSYSFKF